ncbi:right-handed parallel beta-helix repeat-containing protein [Glycomyces buryatensis]|uniref:Pectate lyase n=1 Tax=Glycomyces buryatensis TaxID=2570927 RepID=A0A4S8QET9_9ACTN|nr:right-handed parallel beta-helix repeat-containing protein [Glycomyces buryatensis]THV41622.1 pectate lyase [Glycomyces buryatensis]
MSVTRMKPRKRGRYLFGAAAIAIAGAAGLGVQYGLNPNEAAASQEVVVGSTAELEAAIEDAAAGTTISVKGGTYKPTSSLHSEASGTASAPITLQPYGNGEVIVDGSGLPEESWLLAIHGSYWHVSDMTFENSTAHGVVVTSSTGGVFKNLTTANNGDTGFNLRGDDTVNNLVENLDSYGNYDAAANGENADGIAVKFGTGSGNVIRGARLFENSDDGLDFWSFAGAVRVEDSWAWSNGENVWDDSNFQGDGNGFKLGGDDEAVPHKIINNAAWDNVANGFTENSNTGQMQIYRNTAYDNGGSGFWFQTGTARLARNLSAEGGSADVLGSRTVSAANTWDGVSSPALASTDGSEAYTERGSDGSLPAVDLLVTGSSAIGATMGYL